ncbi:MAG: HEAT repeat domain-containing protein [Kofleriaceae bacterium]
MTSCPVCGKPVDPLRAPAVGVRDGKVVSYCSRAHAVEAESRPVVNPAASEPVFRIPAEDQKKQAEKKKRTPAAGIAQPSATYDSGPVIEIIHEPASGVVTSAPDARDSTNDLRIPRSHASGAIQIADTGRLDDYVSQDDEPIHRRKGWIVVAILVVLGGGAFAAYQLGYLDSLVKHDSHAATTPPAKELALDAGPVDAAVTPTERIEQARTILQRAMTSDSPRVQRVAASALARTGDAAALQALAQQLAKETSDLAKLEMFYALARGNDKRGVDGLVAALTAGRRDVKLEAARRLALLGDKRAIDTLGQYLEVSQLRLGAAEQLAYLAEPRGIKALEAIRADATATADDKARAAIALGYAGKVNIAPALHALLADQRFNAFAAASLANLHDPAAKPVLIRQLDVSALRVLAARSLRRLSPDLDAAALVAPLLTALGSAKDTEQVQAAEALLLLLGPAAWSERE